MGLFDTLRCEHELPDGISADEFQTKSLGCTLSTYHLSAGGQLLDSNGHDTGFHGVFRFYTASPEKGWHEFEAKFTDGQLVHLIPLSSAQYTEDSMRLVAAGT